MRIPFTRSAGAVAFGALISQLSTACGGGQQAVTLRAPSPPRAFLPEASDDEFPIGLSASSSAFPVWPNDFEHLQGALFSPDGATLAVADDDWFGWGCVQEARTTLTLFDTQTWRARAVVSLETSLREWAFDPASSTLLVRVAGRARDDGHSTLAIDLVTGDPSPRAKGALDAELSPPTLTATGGARVANAAAKQVVITDVRTGELETTLALSPQIHVAMVDAAALEVVALWPTGEIAAWDLITSTAARFEPPLSDHQATLFETDEHGVLMLVRRDGDVWRYERDAAGIHRGQVVLGAVHPTSLMIDRGRGRWFAGFADGRIRGFDASDTAVVFSASTRAGRVSSLELWDHEVRAWSPSGINWRFDLSSARLVDVASEGMVGILGGDPDVPDQVPGEEARPEAGCFGSSCSVNVGNLSVRVVPGWRSGSLLLHDGAEFELLGSPGRDAVRCMRGAAVVNAEECESWTRGVQLVAQMQARAAALAALSRE